MSDPTPDAVVTTGAQLSDKASGPMISQSGWDGKARIEKKHDNESAENSEDDRSDAQDDNEEEVADTAKTASVNRELDTVIPGEELTADEDILDDEDPDVEELQLLHLKIQSMSKLGLGRFKKLKRLGLRQNQIPHITIPQEITGTLTELELYDNLISHIKGLDHAVNLEVLDLSFNKIKHIKNIGHLKKLRQLMLVQNKLTRIQNLEGLENLTYLELGANRIREIACLDTLVNLETLWLGQNKITELKGLDALKSLTLLSIQSNRITSLNGLEGLPNLTELYIADNQLTSLEPLVHLPNLTTLEVARNPIASLKGVGHLVNLESFWANGCKIDSFAELDRELADKTALTEVYFEHNPIQTNNPVLYRNKVRLSLPQIDKIDSNYVR